MKKEIFTFWEPKENMPAYIRLCIKTWEKFLPDYKIHILSYENLNEFLSKSFDKSLYKNFSLPKQADAIRCALLKENGGIWLDCDTIITSPDIRNILDINSQLVMIGNHLAFIKSEKNSKILKYWYKKLINNINFYKTHKFQTNKLFYFLESVFHPKLHKNLDSWNYLGNLILKKALKTKNKKLFYKINKFEINAFPELKENKNIEDLTKNYQNFYYNNDFSKEVLENTKGIILLHNSWTPSEYLSMSNEEFLQKNCTLSNILKDLLLFS